MPVPYWHYMTESELESESKSEVLDSQGLDAKEIPQLQ